MATLTDLPEIVGFFSYSRDDDLDSDGALSTFRRRIQSELRAQLGRSEHSLRLWQDAEAIPPGTLWESQIGGALEQSVFFIPIITPRVVRSKYCQEEFSRFLAREGQLGRSDLVFPIIYIEVPELKVEKDWRANPVLRHIGTRQYVDWSEFRFEPDNPPVRRAIASFSKTIVSALKRRVAERDSDKSRGSEEKLETSVLAKKRQTIIPNQSKHSQNKKQGDNQAQTASDADQADTDRLEQRIEQGAVAREQSIQSDRNCVSLVAARQSDAGLPLFRKAADMWARKSGISHARAAWLVALAFTSACVLIFFVTRYGYLGIFKYAHDDPHLIDALMTWSLLLATISVLSVVNALMMNKTDAKNREEP